METSLGDRKGCGMIRGPLGIGIRLVVTGAAKSPPGDPEQRQENRLRILAESAHAFAEATTNASQLLQLVARRCADLMGDGCYIRLLATDGVSLEPVATYHPDPQIERFLHETNDPVPLRVGEGIS